MSEPSVRLSPTSYLILGLIAYRGPSTPYQLKRAVNRSLGYFWPFPHTQLYEEPDRLARAGLLVEEREENGRRRRTYALTDAGRAALTAWLHQPTTDVMQLRDFAALKIFFSEFMSTEALIAMAEEQVRLYDQRLVEYEAIEARYANRPDLGRRMASLDLGFRLARAAQAFWRDIAADPPCCARDEVPLAETAKR